MSLSSVSSSWMNWIGPFLTIELVVCLWDWLILKTDWIVDLVVVLNTFGLRSVYSFYGDKGSQIDWIMRSIGSSYDW